MNDKLTAMQQKWFKNISSLKNKIVVLDHFTPDGKAIFSIEDDDKWATAIIGKRGHIEYKDVIKK